MLNIDSHEALDMELLLAQSLDISREDLNPEKADLWWLGHDGSSYQFENKQASEALGSLDSVEEQIGREMKAATYTGLTIRGVVTPTDEGWCQTWKPAGAYLRKDHLFHQQYVGYRAWIARLWDRGVPVLEVPNLQALVVSVVAAYNLTQKPESESLTFVRIIRTKQWITEQRLKMLLTDHERESLSVEKQTALVAVRAKLVYFLMGLDGVGDEIAISLAREFPSFASLWSWLEEPDGEARLAIVPRASGQGRVGPAIVKRMKGQLGL